MVKFMVISAMALLAGYVISYAALRICYVNELYFTYVLAHNNATRLVVRVAPIYAPLLRAEAVFAGSDPRLYRTY